MSSHRFSQAGRDRRITCRTHDSIPQDVLNRWEREKQDWMRRRGFVGNEHWKTILPTLSASDRFDFTKQFERCREDFLDTGHGRCLLRRSKLAKIVADLLMHFDRQRYRMGDSIVMPNHVHLLAAFASEDALFTQCDSWLHYTAFQINQAIGEKGKFWQQEPFDHLVRSPAQYEYLRKYIEKNGAKARLSPNEYLYRRYEV